MISDNISVQKIHQVFMIESLHHFDLVEDELFFRLPCQINIFYGDAIFWYLIQSIVDSPGGSMQERKRVGVTELK